MSADRRRVLDLEGGGFIEVRGSQVVINLGAITLLPAAPLNEIVFPVETCAHLKRACEIAYAAKYKREAE